MHCATLRSNLGACITWPAHPRLQCTPAAGDWAALRQAILEEELRRCQSWGPLAHFDLGEPAAITRLLGVDPEAVVAEVMARWDAAAGEEEVGRRGSLGGVQWPATA